jgi:DNA-binding transcriptional regulator YiaG
MKDPAHFESFMAQHGLNNRHMSRLFGVSIRSVIYWKQGKIEAPNAVHLLMRAIQQGRLDMEWVKDEVEQVQWGR